MTHFFARLLPLWSSFSPIYLLIFIFIKLMKKRMLLEQYDSVEDFDLREMEAGKKMRKVV
jgi:hypothetical protein